MAIPRSKRRKIIIIVILTLQLMEAAFDNDADSSLYEDTWNVAEGAKCVFWDSDENNWTNEESAAWSAVEALHDALVNEQGDEKIADTAGQLDTALSTI